MVFSLKHKRADGTTSEDADLHLYCPKCGAISDRVFHQNEFVLVAAHGEKPYYARLVAVEAAQEGPIAMVEQGRGERVRVHLDYVEKL